MTRILLTTTSYQDTPGEHHDLLREAGYEVVTARGPLRESAMLGLVGDIDGLICGDDEITWAVMERALPRLRVISKYGIGVDKIDVAAATELGLPVLFTPGVNHTTVAEHTFLLLLALVKNLVEEANHTAAGRWKRITGHEIMGKTLGIVGLGRIGKEVAVRGKAFGMEVMAVGNSWDDEFAGNHGVRRMDSVDSLLVEAEIVSLHTNLTDETRNMINSDRLGRMKDGVIILNCARGELVETEGVIRGLQSGKIAGYGSDVLDVEPPPEDHPLLRAPHCLITPHIGSRTYESVVRQAGMATRNLVFALDGKKPLAQVNDVPIKAAGSP